MIKWTTILAAACGLGVAVYAVSTASFAPPNLPLAAPPSINPFPKGIAATGVVEAGSRNVQVAAPEGAVVTKVFREVGEGVNVGDPLFELDSRTLQADLVRARAARDVQAAALRRLEQQPRPEEVPALESAVRDAEAELADWNDQLDMWSKAMKEDAAGDTEIRRRKFAVLGAEARLERVKANLALTKAGAWGPDLDVARAELAQAEASVTAVEILVERRTVRSPIAGTVLKRNIEPGQYAPADAKNSTMTVGDLTRLHVRARVDEEDLPGLRDGAKGIARVRGRADLTVPLKMVRIEPLAEPKTALSGSTTERVDTRVLETIFEVEGTPPVTLYPGQLLDVYIDAAAAGGV